MSTAHESRPQANPGAAKSFGGDCTQYSDTTDIISLASHEWHVFMDGYESGYSAGIERGREIADEEAATLQREAARIVHYMAGIPPRDAEADRAAAEKRAARWGQ